MAILSITKAYAAGSALLESHIDHFRNGLLTLFNTDKLSAVNFSQGMNLTSAKFASNAVLTANNSYIFLGSDNDCKFGMDGSANLVFDTTQAATEIRLIAGARLLEICSDKIRLDGTIHFSGGAATGFKGVLGKWHVKPVLEWYSTTAIYVSGNTYSTDQTVIHFPAFTAKALEVISTSAKYRYASTTATANGYGTADAGAALGGKRSGLVFNTNSWYYVYAAKLRSGMDFSATTAKFIIVIDDTAPTPANEATLNTRYGTGNFVYLGLIRYGYGATGSASEIVKFKYSNKGRCILYGLGASGYAGLNLAYSTADVDDTATPLYTVSTSGISGNVIPSIIGHCTYAVVREKVSDWYIQSGAKTIWRGGWQSDDPALAHGFQVELPLVSGMTFHQVRTGLGIVAKAVVLTGFTDSYRAMRNQGKGI